MSGTDEHPGELAILDATVWTGDRPGIHRDTTIVIDDGQIVYIGPTRPGDRELETIIEGDDLFVTPGLIDAHAHTGHRLGVGLAQDVPEIEWMDKALGPVASATTAADHEVASRLAIVEAISSGVTTICEYGRDIRDRLEGVHLPAGVRTVGVETINEVVDRPEEGPYALDREAGVDARERTDSLISLAETHDRVSVMYGPQALDMVTPETMDEIVDEARESDRRVHIHVAQGGRERRQLQARYGVDSAAQLLEDRDWLDERLVAAHLHGATTSQRATLADAGVSMVGCPSSIAAIDGVIPPVHEYRDHGGIVALGTDQAPGGSGGHHLLAECRAAWLQAKLATGDPTALPVWEALSLVTTDAAHVLGIDDRVGTIEVGKRADIACFDLTSPPFTGTSTAIAATPITALVSGGGRVTARHVLVDGEFILRDGTVVNLDQQAVIDEAQRHANDLHERAAADWENSASTLVEAVSRGEYGVHHPS